MNRLSLFLEHISYRLRFKKYSRFVKKILYTVIIRINKFNIDKEMWDIVLRINKSKEVITYACCGGHDAPLKIGYIACQFLGNDHSFEALTSVLRYSLFGWNTPFKTEGNKGFVARGNGMELFIKPKNKEFTVYWYTNDRRKQALDALYQVLDLIEEKHEIKF